MFVENVGQLGDGVRFQVRGSDRAIYLADDAIWVTVLERPRLSPDPRDGGHPSPHSPIGFGVQGLGERGEGLRGVHLRLSFPGANPNPRLEPFNRLDTHVSYFVGNDPARWRSDVPVWGGVRYRDLYPGIDLIVTGEGGRMVQRMAVQPSADLGVVRLRVEGADGLSVEGNGLYVATALGSYALPLVQVAGWDGFSALSLGQGPEVRSLGESVHEVIAPFGTGSVVSAGASPAAAAGASDLLYATFLGGSASDEGWSIAVDSSGAAYVTGNTWSSDFQATPGAYDTSHNGYSDAFVASFRQSVCGRRPATFVEVPFRLPLEAGSLRGRIDRLDSLPDGRWDIVDFKSGASSANAASIYRRQLALYALAVRELWRVPAGRVSAHLFFVRDGRDLEFTFDDAELDLVRNLGEAALAAIVKGEFPRVADSHRCAACWYTHLCASKGSQPREASSLPLGEGKGEGRRSGLRRP